MEPDVVTESNRFTTLSASEKHFDVKDSEANSSGNQDDNSHIPQSIIPTPWRFAGETVRLEYSCAAMFYHVMFCAML